MQRWTAVAGAGVLGGLVAIAVFVVLPSPWDSLANTSALWGLVPFAVAARMPRAPGVGAGVVALTAMVLTWIAVAPVAISAREVAVFLVVGVAAGALCGAAGGALPRSEAVAGTTVMCGLLLGEAFYGMRVIGGPHWFAEAALAVLVATVCLPPVRSRALALLGGALLATVLGAAYLAYDAIVSGSG